MALIFPSLIAADLLNLQKEIEQLDPVCDGYHLDIMDNHFVPNLTWGPAFIEAISRGTKRKLWIHLMVDNPESWVQKLSLPPDSIISFHLESTNAPLELIDLIEQKELLPSVALSPETDVKDVFSFCNTLYSVLVMSVEPGFSGQQFMPAMVDKVDALVAHRKQHTLDFRIAMDGGINKENIKMIADHGVDDLGVANAIFAQADPVKALQELKKLAS